MVHDTLVVGVRPCVRAIFEHNSLRVRFRDVEKVVWKNDLAARAEAIAMAEGQMGVSKQNQGGLRSIFGWKGAKTANFKFSGENKNFAETGQWTYAGVTVSVEGNCDLFNIVA